MGNKGFTIVEMMVSLTVGLIIMTQVMAAFGVSSRNLMFTGRQTSMQQGMDTARKVIVEKFEQSTWVELVADDGGSVEFWTVEDAGMVLDVSGNVVTVDGKAWEPGAWEGCGIAILSGPGSFVSDNDGTSEWSLISSSGVRSVTAKRGWAEVPTDDTVLNIECRRCIKTLTDNTGTRLVQDRGACQDVDAFLVGNVSNFSVSHDEEENLVTFTLELEPEKDEVETYARQFKTTGTVAIGGAS